MSILTAPGTTDVHDQILRDLRRTLDESSLPDNLKARLMRDSDGGQQYRRLLSIAELTVRAPNSSYLGYKLGGCACRETVLVTEGNVAMLMDNGSGSFLGPGYHSVPVFGVEVGEQVSLSTLNRVVKCETAGFITITEGNIGVLQLGSEYRLLAPGSYEWDSPVVGNITAVNIRANASQLGPFSLVTVTDGTVAVTYHHGSLRILGWSPEEPPVGSLAASSAARLGSKTSPVGTSRTYFMDDPNWVHKSFLSTQMQTDRLEGNDLLSKDNVELLMVAMSQWRIVNPWLAITQCGPDMDNISTKVDQLVRATIARIVAGTCIGAGPVSGHMTRPIAQVGREVGSEGVEQLVGGDDQRDERLFVEHAHEADGRKAPVLQIENRHGMRDARPRRVFGDRRPGDPLWRLAVRVPDECQRADRESPGRGRTALVEVGDVVHVDRLHEKVFDDIIVVAHEHRDGPLVGREAAVRCGPLRCVLNPREHTVPLPPRVEAVAHVAEERRIRDDRARAREHGRPRLRQSPHGPNVPDPHRCALDVNRVSLAPPGRLPRRACLETAFEEVVVVTVEAPLDLRIDARDLDDLEPLDVRQRLLDTRHGDRESVTVSRGRHERHAVGIFGAPLRRCRLRRPPASRLVVGALERIPLGVHSG